MGRSTVEDHAGRGITVRDVLTYLERQGTRPSRELIRVDRDTVRLVSTSQPFGGVRWWLVCPCCHRRATRLFHTYLGLACRRCAKLAYESTREAVAERHERRGRKIAARIGGWFGELPTEKPKRMRWSTFDRLYAQAEREFEAAECSWLAGALRDADALIQRVQGSR